MSETRYFEFVDEKSSKFWEVTFSGQDVSVRFGRIGTNGQMKTKSLPNGEAAHIHAENLVNEKRKKGYVEKAMSRIY